MMFFLINFPLRFSCQSASRKSMYSNKLVCTLVATKWLFNSNIRAANRADPPGENIV